MTHFIQDKLSQYQLIVSLGLYNKIVSAHNPNLHSIVNSIDANRFQKFLNQEKTLKPTEKSDHSLCSLSCSEQQYLL